MKICFVGNLSSTFVKRDYEILKKHFDVDVVKLPKTKFGWIKYPSLVKKKIKESDAVFGWFAGWHTAFAVHYAKRYGKKSTVVVGGYDAAYVPEINYGAFMNIKEKIPAKYVLENADLLLPVSEFTKNEILKKANPIGKIKVVYNGVDTESVVLHYEGEIESKLEELKIYAPFSNPFLVGKQGRIFIPVKIQAEKEARVFIYNLLGELVREFRITTEGGESLLLAWDGRNNRGKLVSTGVYFVVLKQGNKIAKTKILLLK